MSLNSDSEAHAATLAGTVVESVREFVQRSLEPFLLRLSALEKRQPEKGLDGAPGADGQHGRDGVDGQDGKPGRDGQDGPIGKDGAQGERGLSGLQGERGEKGLPGHSGRDGRDGQEGVPGRDAVQIAPLADIDFGRSYPMGTYAKHRGGLWRAAEKTHGERGWECIVVGISDIELIQDAKDFRKSTLRVILSDQVKEFEPRNDAPCWHDGYKAGDACERGDIVVFGGSAWIAREATKATPGTGSDDWTILARRGRDGKDGERGERGAKGDEGRAGRDMTQLGSEGRKW